MKNHTRITLDSIENTESNNIFVPRKQILLLDVEHVRYISMCEFSIMPHLFFIKESSQMTYVIYGAEYFLFFFLPSYFFTDIKSF